MRTLIIGLMMVLCFGTVLASPPPFPDEMKYPNVVPPRKQFGGYGSGLGQMNEPVAVAVSKQSEIYIADTFNNRVIVYSVDGVFLRSWGSLGRDSGKLVNPQGIFVGSDGKVYVSDTGNGRIQVYDALGNYIRTIGTGIGGMSGHLNEPMGLAVKGEKIYVADRGNERVAIFGTDGTYEGQIGELGTADGQFNYPTDVAIDDSGFVYVADAYNNRIQKFDNTGKYVAQWGGWGSYSGLFANPSSVSFAGDKLYVGDLINHRIQVFDDKGNYLYQWGRHPPTGHEGNGRLHYPAKVAVAPDDSFSVVCEPFEYRCQVFDTSSASAVHNVDDKAWWDKGSRFHYGTRAVCQGGLMTIAEPDTHSVLVFDITADKPKLLTRLGGQGRALGSFVRPSGMTINSDSGEIIVSDGGNHRLQEFELSRMVPASAEFAPNVSRVVRAKSVIGLALPHISAQGFDGSNASPVEPSALARDKDGSLYMADPHNSRVIVLDKDMNPVRTIGHYGSGDGELEVPNDISFSKDGETLYIVDTYNFRIEAFDRKTGNYKFQWGAPGAQQGNFIHPFGIASGNDGFVYVSDDAANRIQKFDEAGNFVLTFGRWGTEPGQFYKPKGVTQDYKGRIIVADFGNHRGQIFTSSGDYLDMFGIGEGYTPPLVLANQAHVLASAGPSSQISNGGSYVVTYSISDGAISIGQPFALTLRILNAQDHSDASDVGLSVSATMPAHYHGMNTQPTVERAPDGSWHIKGMLFHMPGAWQLNFDISGPNGIERAQADYLLQ
ncbi:NHL repeat-containing protein [Rhizobium mayense]|uniref:NHL repeat-containing protein n=1 Tax=Rhizobium mayense TaxID=1312184 RepID=A0ABT7JSW6_9HYPH|nr:NHL repeat-containing protein [Rhizobium mayense]MDL2399450.1 NHL repeat-containing protein [Rhizobium mayense]